MEALEVAIWKEGVKKGLVGELQRGKGGRKRREEKKKSFVGEDFCCFRIRLLTLLVEC